MNQNERRKVFWCKNVILFKSSFNTLHVFASTLEDFISTNERCLSSSEIISCVLFYKWFLKPSDIVESI